MSHAEPVFRAILLRTVIRVTIVILVFAIIGQYGAWQAVQAAPIVQFATHLPPQAVQPTGVDK